ncbi:hypothetical protein BKA69DRAFT_1174234 [Paraphysoderma sedebokerense]|nr:hypothetical protein BKA69DRAFT_1174234 [Paraphysoderma sedebokerense]
MMRLYLFKAYNTLVREKFEIYLVYNDNEEGIMDTFERYGKSSSIIAGICYGLIIAIMADSAQSLTSYKIVYMSAVALFGTGMLLAGISVNSSSVTAPDLYIAVGLFTMLTLPTVTAYVGMRYKLLSRSIHSYHNYLYALIGIEYLMWVVAIIIWYAGNMVDATLIPPFLRLYAAISIYHTIINTVLTGMIIKLLLATMNGTSGATGGHNSNASKIKLCILIFAVYFALVIVTGLTMTISFLTFNVQTEIFVFNNIAIMSELISLFLSSKFVAVVAAAGTHESTSVLTPKFKSETSR